jgi:hypothetical protein
MRDMWLQPPSTSRREETTLRYRLLRDRHTQARPGVGPQRAQRGANCRAAPISNAQAVNRASLHALGSSRCPPGRVSAYLSLPSSPRRGSQPSSVASGRYARRHCSALRQLRNGSSCAPCTTHPWRCVCVPLRLPQACSPLRSPQAGNARKCAEPHFVHAGGWDEESGWEEWDSSRGGVDPRQSPPQSSAFSCRGRRKRCGLDAPRCATRAAATVLTCSRAPGATTPRRRTGLGSLYSSLLYSVWALSRLRCGVIGCRTQSPPTWASC